MKSAPPERELVTVKEAAALIPCSRSSVYRLMKAGELRSRRVRFVGRRIELSSVLALVRGRSGAVEGG